MTSEGDLNWKLHDAFVKAYFALQEAKGRSNRQQIQKKATSKWLAVKNTGRVQIESQTRLWKEETQRFNSKSNIMSFFKNASSEPPATEPTTSADASVDATMSSSDNEEETSAIQLSTTGRKATKQESLQRELKQLNEEIDMRRKLSSLSSSARVRELLELKKTKEFHLKRLQTYQRSTHKYRASKKAEGPSPKSRGRPSLESQGIYVKDAVIDYFESTASADGKRRTERLEACLTLDRLQQVLHELYDMDIKRSTLYTRLLPRNSLTHEGKRHHDCAPVRLLRPQNDVMAQHRDGHFASATVKYMKDFAAFLGPSCVSFISQDDKAMVPLGIPAVNKHVRMAMHLQYKVSLPDHDWVVAERHKLIPSVYAGCVVGDKKVLPNGPTFIAIRSGKHDSSTASSDMADFFELIELESFHDICKTSSGRFKPILLVTVDGGPDESPRSPKTLLAWAEVFKMLDLDFLMVATHAPGQSAYNAVERRMAPLSKDLSGLILPYDTFGTHLDKSGKTVDEEKEKQNFAAAGQILAEIWSKSIIAQFPVEAKFVDPDAPKAELTQVTEVWKRNHVLQTRYTCQIRKCTDASCCGKPRTNFRAYLGDGFIPPPVPFRKTSNGLVVAVEEGHFGSLQDRMLCWNIVDDTPAFDSYCPSMMGKVDSQTCATCKQYFATKKALLDHRKADVCSGMGVQPEDDLLLEDSDDEDRADLDRQDAPTISYAPIVDDNDVKMARFGLEEEADE